MLNNFIKILKIFASKIIKSLVLFTCMEEMKLNKNIEQLRKKYNLTQGGLAEKLNVTRQTISNWEQGVTYPNPEQLLTLSKIFNISVDELLANEKIRSNKLNINYIPLYVGIIFSIVSLVITYSLNRFKNIEIFFITIYGFIVGYLTGDLIKVLLNRK